MKVEEIDLELMEQASEDKLLVGKIANDFAKSYFTVYRWLKGDFENLPPLAYEMIKKHFKNKS